VCVCVCAGANVGFFPTDALEKTTSFDRKCLLTLDKPPVSSVKTEKPKIQESNINNTPVKDLQEASKTSRNRPVKLRNDQEQ
jgi:hypothetical protein